MTADDLATQGARTSVAMVMPLLSQDIQDLPTEGLTDQSHKSHNAPIP